MDLGAVEDYLQPDTFDFTLRGHQFSVAQCDAETGLRLQVIAAKAAEAFQDPTKDIGDATSTTSEDLYRLSLGDVYPALLALKPTLAELERVGVTAFWWQLGSDDVAEATFTGGSGKAPVPPTSAEAAAMTPRRASGTGARTKPSTTAKGRPASRGRSSSTTGL